MEERKLSWPERGKLWARLGIRLALVVLALWLLRTVGLPLLSLFAPFVAALITAAILHPPIRWLQRRLGVPRKFSTLLILLLLFGLLGAESAIWGTPGRGAGGPGAELERPAGEPAEHPGSDRDHVRPAVEAGAGPAHRRGGVGDPGVHGVAEQRNAQPAQRAVEYTTDKARGVPDVVLALIIYIMACYMLTVDYPYLRSQAVQHTHQRLLHFLKQVRDTALAAFGGYLRAEFLLSVVVFFILLVGFFVIGQPYGLLLALVLAVMDFIPIIGAGTVMVPWAVVDLFMGNYFHAVQLMVIWGAIALFRRVGEPKFVGDQTGLSPIASLISIYIGWRLAGVLGMILGPTIALIALNLIRLGIFEGCAWTWPPPSRTSWPSSGAPAPQGGVEVGGFRDAPAVGQRPRGRVRTPAHTA